MCLPGWHETAFAEEEISEPGRMNRASRKEEEEKECLQEERSNMRGGRWRVDALKFSAYSGEAGRLDAWSLGAGGVGKWISLQLGGDGKCGAGETFLLPL